MIKSDFEAIKGILFRYLKKESNPLPEDTIFKTADKVNKFLSTPEGRKFYAFDTGKEDLQNLSTEDWKRLIQQLEKQFDVKMNIGTVVQGDEQRLRDTTWWTGLFKAQSDNYYWNRYSTHVLEDEFTPLVVKTIDDDTDAILNNLGNPKNDHAFDRYGMVVGHVQSGKTANYTGLICKAADAGYKFIVVIAGALNNLRNQTQERINENFVGKNGDEYVKVGIGNSDNSKLPWSLTTDSGDFDIKTANRLSQSGNFDNMVGPVIIVIKKHSRTLSNVKKWLNSHYNNKINHPILLIDDESDYASVNTKDEDDPATINRKIRELLGLFNKRTYVAYTATPFANIFIDHKASSEAQGKDLFPRDFIYSLDAPTNYLGARKVFLENQEKHIITINDYLDDIPAKHKKDYELFSLPPSLLEAIRLFVINIAIRELRGQYNKHNSMLIHASRFTNMHIQTALLTSDYLKDLKREFINFGKLENCDSISQLISETLKTFTKYYSNLNIEKKSVTQVISDTIDSIVVREAHQKTKIPLEYRKDINTNAIVIGGTSLSRGYTIEGLSVSYFLRNTVFYDTLMQMGRWFGYRIGYEDLCKIFMPTNIADDFTEIIETTEDLFEEFKLMSESDSTPEKYGLAIRQHPGSALQVTGRNKLKHIEKFRHRINLNGQLKETRKVLMDEKSIEANINATINLFSSMDQAPEEVGNDFLWSNIDKNIIQTFGTDFKHYSDDRDPLGLRSKFPIKAIKKYIETNNSWDIALYSGTGSVSSDVFSQEFKRPIRTVTVKSINETEHYEIGNRQLSSGSDEGISLKNSNETYKHISRKEDRREREKQNGNPLLMIYVLDAKVKDEELLIPNLVAYGISFPGSSLSTGQEIELLINTVYYEDLINEDHEE
jgi:hypothetical protein